MKNRLKMSREELLAEIEFAEAILDSCGADEGLTLWGRIASIKSRLDGARVCPECDGAVEFCAMGHYSQV